MGRKGSQKNERKSNENRVDANKVRADRARQEIKTLEQIPFYFRPDDYHERLRREKGILKRAVQAQSRSETHSRKEKGDKR